MPPPSTVPPATRSLLSTPMTGRTTTSTHGRLRHFLRPQVTPSIRRRFCNGFQTQRIQTPSGGDGGPWWNAGAMPYAITPLPPKAAGYRHPPSMLHTLQLARHKLSPQGTTWLLGPVCPLTARHFHRRPRLCWAGDGIFHWIRHRMQLSRTSSTQSPRTLVHWFPP